MTEQIEVRILHNENERDSFFRGYSEGDPLNEVYSGMRRLPHREEESIINSLEYIFMENQWRDLHRPWYNDARSLSVGDVIVLGEKAYACDHVGFSEVNSDGLE